MLAFASALAPALRCAPRAAVCARSSLRRPLATASAGGPGPADVAGAVAAHRVMVFSKSSCPYCKQAKSLLLEVGARAEVWELNTLQQGKEIQAELLGMTGQRTVPNIFIGGSHIGGCDDLMDLHYAGELEKLLAGASIEQ
jgi:glutaredoxin 3